MCKTDVPEGIEGLMPISLFVWKILRKNERRALNTPPPSQSRARSSTGSDVVSKLQNGDVRSGHSNCPGDLTFQARK